MRDHGTYRSERRTGWWAIRQNAGAIPWRRFNENLAQWGFDIGSGDARAHSTILGRSRYTPHQGKQEMARRVRQSLARAA